MDSLDVELQMPGEVYLAGEDLLIDAKRVVVEERGEAVGRVNACLWWEPPDPHRIVGTRQGTRRRGYPLTGEAEHSL